MEGIDVPKPLLLPYAQTLPAGPMRLPMKLKTHHPKSTPKERVVGLRITAESAADALEQFAAKHLIGNRSPIFTQGGTALAALKELYEGVAPDPPKHPYMNNFGDYTDEYWTSPEFLMISARVPEFLKHAGVTSISSATHGDHLAAQFEDYIALKYPDEWKKVEAMGPYGDALQAWHEDHQNDVSE